MQESLVPVGRPVKRRKSPAVSRDPNRAGPSRTTSNDTSKNNRKRENKNGNETKNDEPDEHEQRIPMLVRGIGVHTVIPKEATRDVLSGKVAFYLVDDRQGVTLFPPQHIFTALKLGKIDKEKFADYSCVGAHQRIFDKKPKHKEGLGYRRKFIDPELINRGIYTHYFDTFLPKELCYAENQLERCSLYKAWEPKGLTVIKDYSPTASFHRVFDIKPRFYSSPARIYRQLIYGGCYTRYFDTLLQKELRYAENQLERYLLYKAWERKAHTVIKDYSPSASFYKVFDIKPRFYSSPARIYRQLIYGGCYAKISTIRRRRKNYVLKILQ